MPLIIANSDSGVKYDLTVSKASGTTLSFSFQLAGAPQDVHADTWQLLINNSAGTAVVTLASGTGLTLAGSNIQAAITTTNLSSLTTYGGYSWQLKDTTTSRTRINGNFILQP